MGKTNSVVADFGSQLPTQEELFAKPAAKIDDQPTKSEDVVNLSQEEIFKVSKEEPTGKQDDGKALADEKKSPSTSAPEESAPAGATKSPDSLVFAKSLKEQGLLDDIDEEVFMKIAQESGDFYEPLRVTIKENFSRREKQLVDQLTEQAKGYREWREMMDKGIDPQQALSLTYQKDKLGQITDDILKENQDVRKDVLYNFYKQTTQFSDQDINKLIDDQITLKKDVDVAKTALPQLINILNGQERQLVEQESQRRIEEQKRFDESLADLRTKTSSLNEFLGVKLHSKTKDEIYDMVAKPSVKYQDGSETNTVWADYYKDPNTFMAKVALMMKLGVWDGKVDRIKQVVKNEVVDDVQKVITNQAQLLEKNGGISVPHKDETQKQRTAKQRAEENLDELRKAKSPRWDF
jgi:hypothetical protein